MQAQQVQEHAKDASPPTHCMTETRERFRERNQ